MKYFNEEEKLTIYTYIFSNLEDLEFCVGYPLNNITNWVILGKLLNLSLDVIEGTEDMERETE